MHSDASTLHDMIDGLLHSSGIHIAMLAGIEAILLAAAISLLKQRRRLYAYASLAISMLLPGAIVIAFRRSREADWLATNWPSLICIVLPAVPIYPLAIAFEKRGWWAMVARSPLCVVYGASFLALVFLMRKLGVHDLFLFDQP